MHKIIAIKGSPHQNSSSNLLVEKCLDGLKDKLEDVEAKVIYPHLVNISPCRACQYCYETAECIIDDEMGAIIEDLNQADIILISAPVFFNGVPSQLKALIDRCQVIWASKYEVKEPIIDTEKERRGYLFTTGGAPEYPKQFVGVHQEIEMFFRALNTEFIGSLTVEDVDGRPVSNREELLSKAYQISEKLINGGLESE